MVLLLLLAGCISQPPANITLANVTLPANITQANITPVNLTQPSAENITLPIVTISPCNRISAQPERDACVAEVALRLKEAGLCAQVAARDRRFACALSVASATRNASACLQLGEEAGRCVLFLVPNIGGEGCALISGPEREMCEGLAASLRGAEACVALAGRAREVCARQVAQNTGNTSVCELLAGAAREGCSAGARRAIGINISWSSCADAPQAARDGCYYQQGVARGDPALCMRISNADMREGCLVVQDDGALSAAALNQSNPSALYCKYIRAPEMRDACYEWVAIYLLDQGPCAFVSHKDIKDACFAFSKASDALERIVAFGNPEGCAVLNFLGEKDACYARIAAAKGDATICEKITKEPMRVECALSLLSQQNAATVAAICEGLTNEEVKANCTHALG